MKNTRQVRLGLISYGRNLLRVIFACLIAGLMVSTPSNSAGANENERKLEQQVQVESAHWQLLRWSDGAVTCNIYIKHPGQPSTDEIDYSCGTKILQDWLTTPACSPAQANGAGCSGLMLRYVGAETRTETKTVELPKINLRLFLTDCMPGQWCEARPGLKLVAEEPVGGYQITNIHVRVSRDEKAFPGSSSELRLPATGEDGAWFEYWAESDFGDSSERFAIKYRAYAGIQDGRRVYRFDLLTEEWASTLPGGALLWEIFPPAEANLPRIFEQPLSPGYLATTNRYALLAGKLIRSGLVDATSCSDRGLLANGAASICGESAAADAVLTWQNKYDQQIYEAGLRYNVPSRIIKGVIAQESQFWPESSDPYELGLGYVTENGVSMLLLWNLEYYLSTCMPVYGWELCSAGYANLREDRQTVIRGAVFERVGTNAEIDLIAAMLYASAAQTQQLVKNVIRAEPADVTSYEDMWNMTIANYYAGSGCLGEALRASLNEPFPLGWDTVASKLEGSCTVAEDYVWRVIHYSD